MPFSLNMLLSHAIFCVFIIFTIVYIQSLSGTILTIKGSVKMAGIQDVAKEAGVSVATVSRVINQAGNVLPDTARKVNQAIEKLHYKPSPTGRSKNSGKNKTNYKRAHRHRPEI